MSIVGSDLKMVENVLGRLTRGRAAAAGAASGAWFGLFVGVLLSFFANEDTNAFAPDPVRALLYGAAFGAIFGFVGHALSRRQARLHLAQQDRGELATRSAAPGPRPTRPARCSPG